MRGCGRRRAALLVLGATALASPAARADVHVVDQVDLAFVPEEITVAPGDTVRWVWSSGFHTVTTGVDCVFDGGFLNDLLTEDFPIVELVIPDDFVGDIPYFCQPHCRLGMVGLVSVVAVPGCAGDIDGNQVVDFADILRVLEAWGPCEGKCPEDLDESGAVDFGDILIILESWGPCEEE